MASATAIRLAGWIGGFAAGGAAFGMDWAVQGVELPLWALLMLTFLPTVELMVWFSQFLPGEKRIELVDDGDEGE